VRISGGRPWVAAECWRLAAIAGLVLCAWGMARVTSSSAAHSRAVVAGVLNPAVLVILVAGIHNDALMLGLSVAGLALVISGRHATGIVLVALGVAVKPNAFVVVAALAWWAWGSGGRDRIKGILAAGLAVVGVLAACGLVTGGGFGWIREDLLYGGIPGPWSLGADLIGSAVWPVDVIELAGIVLAAVLVFRPQRPDHYIVGVGWAFAALAVTAPRPEPWYLTWAVVMLACGGLHRRVERTGIAIMGATMIGTILPFQFLWWSVGVIALAWLGVSSTRRSLRSERPPPSETALSSGADVSDVQAIDVSPGVRG
jgi:hypothetical protein